VPRSCAFASKLTSVSRRRNELVPDQPSVVVLESYVSSSEGPTIRVDMQTVTRLNKLETIMRNLGSGRSSRVLLSQLGDTHWVYPLTGVVLTIGPKWATPQISYDKHREQLLCEWIDSLEGIATFGRSVRSRCYANLRYEHLLGVRR
jgi:hypothetical protein